MDGKIVGFNSLVAVDGEAKSEQFGFIGTSDQILELMNDVGVKNDVGALGRSYKKGLDAYFEGDKEVAVAALQTVVDEGPDNETTKDYLAKAKKLPDPAPIGLYIGVGAAVLAVIVAVSILLMRRGRNKGGSPTPPSSSVTTPQGDQKPTAIEPPVDPNACSSCGSTLGAGAKFCPNCGSPTA